MWSRIGIFLLIVGFYLPVSSVLAGTGAASLQVEVIAAPECGNGEVEAGEQCDLSDLNGQTCQGLDYAGGTLSCYANCTFNTSNCTAGGGGGGGGGWLPPPPETKVIFQGKAYPNASVNVLKDGQPVVIVPADPQADFNVQLTDLTAGTYTFGIWAEDKDGRRSITFNFTITITSGTITTVSNIFLSPTIALSKESLEQGEILDIYGQTVPQGSISIYVYSEEIIKEAKADGIGLWTYPLDTAILAEGSHTTKVKSTLENLISTFSQTLSFYLGEGAPGVICWHADLNGDGRVNLVDFSILLYWWGRANDCADQNNNGVVDLADFSIMMYYWTG